jgi:hypothetical protein
MNEPLIAVLPGTNGAAVTTYPWPILIGVYGWVWPRYQP